MGGEDQQPRFGGNLLAGPTVMFFCGMLAIAGSLGAELSWLHLSSSAGDLPISNGGHEQTAALTADVNGDGVAEIFLADRSVAPALVALIRHGDRWERHVIEAGPLRVEAGSAAEDIDGDGDLDVVFGGDGQSSEIWWWENPFPDLRPDRSWCRHSIKTVGGKKHHDLVFVDFDGDGRRELVFWNQGSHGLLYAEIPPNPTKVEEWPIRPIYRYAADDEMEQRAVYPEWRWVNEHEGLAVADMNGDGIDDIVGGGRWFEFQEGGFVEHVIDAGYTFTRCAAEQLIEGGRPEVVLVVGDGVGPLMMYEWRQGVWTTRTLLSRVENGHTLQVVDADGDGRLDVFTAEMRLGGENPGAKVRLLFGDGRGRFREQVVAEGIGVHEGRMADLDGDGDLDILGKPYNWDTPRVDIWLNTTSR
ncbi:MAG TPA: VCBS repeat-containing protein [Acidobacteriota bacterium]|nr:VCBS repeat-containing protein [Acidobacteriota bacterium]